MGKVFCVIPVHNRLACLKRCVGYLNAQDYDFIHIVIVDDGSTDGTPEYLAALPKQNLTVLTGDGNLWWGGAMRMGMEYVLTVASTEDYLLMMNDDVSFDEGYVSQLVRASCEHKAAVVGSIQRDQATGKVLYGGISINYATMKIGLLNCSSGCEHIGGLPGRGVLYPMPVVQKVGLVNSTLFPHYFGDTEYSARAKDKGFTLMVSKDAHVFMDATSSDQKIRQKGFLVQWLHPRSKSNLFRWLLFFSLRGPVPLRVTAVPRFAGVILFRGTLRLLRRGK